MPIFQPELETLPRPELEQLQRERLRERFGIELEALPEQPFGESCLTGVYMRQDSQVQRSAKHESIPPRWSFRPPEWQ